MAVFGLELNEGGLEHFATSHHIQIFNVCHVLHPCHLIEDRVLAHQTFTYAKNLDGPHFYPNTNQQLVAMRADRRETCA